MSLRELNDEEFKRHEKEVLKRYLSAYEEYDAVVKEMDWRAASKCEHCKTGKLLSGHGGGVKCDTCNYWFCY
ncbi:hypothetical protein PP935_gp233 [Rhizobium phage RHph_N34]|uniref:Uncharacterized protein n=1 Tax=Rhizobium phage RHph_N34 TaxID=2509586 RepID=A0A7S5RAL7_9CAUD|nr:hypothetical protein PP935_gp233 [Rhizobium phage RHph_N34]QIG74008.1 hypothetical protein EVC06_233 [Rhizobium phage RHph_N34]